MKHSTLFFSLLALILVLCAGSTEAKTIKELANIIKDPLTIKAKKSPTLDVTFAHTIHRGINCFTCHHAAAENKGRYIPCGECHVPTEPVKSKEPLSRFAAFHSKTSSHSCYACHQQKAKEAHLKYGRRFYNCRPCHLKAREKTTAQQ
ncbi:MAG: cytochrome c family protein [Desulfovibrio sp.]|nr:cytochrome c family protein [Desulfovibrio sp.]